MKVSIIIPVYNGGSKLLRCLQSVTQQTFSDFEIIAVNDGSTDESLCVLQEYQRQEPRLNVYDTENHGVSAARNFALKHARGKYIRFVDCDDVLPADSLERLVSRMEADQAQLAIAPFLEVRGSEVIKRTQISGSDCLNQQAYLTCVRQYPRCFYYSVLWNKLYHRSLIEKHRLSFDESLSWSEDFLFNIQYLAHVDTVAVLDTPVYQYYHYVSGLTLKFTRTFILHPFKTLRMFRLLYINYRNVCLQKKGASLRAYLLFLKKTNGC